MGNRPNLTVATVVFNEDKFLMVREKSDGKLVYNQPAGHVEPEESITAAAIRETLEETAWEVRIQGYLGVYQHTSTDNGISYVRHCFIAEPVVHRNALALDPDIESALWLTRAELENLQEEMRSPMVLRAIEDFNQGISFPLTLFRT